MNLLKNKKFLTIAICIFIALIMIGSVLNIRSENSTKVKYNNHIFVKTNNGWLTFVNNNKHLLSYNPKELEDIKIPNINIAQLNYLEKIYLSLNPEENVRNAIAEFNSNIKLTPQIVTACTIDIPQCSDLPLKTCNDTTTSIGVIIFKESNSSKISLNNNCLTIEGNKEGIIKVTDKLVLKFLSII